MKRFVLCLFFIFSIHLLNAQFTAGNIVVLRVTGGSALDNSSTSVFLDEYTTTGTLVKTDSIPNMTAGDRLTLSGTSISEGLLTLSQDGRYLFLGGYDAAVGVAAIAGTNVAAVNRVAGRIDFNGNIDLTTKIIDGYSTGNISSVASDDGNRIWASGNGTGGGVRYVTLGNTGPSIEISTSSTDTRALNISSNQLYTTSGAGLFHGVNSVGTGLPVTPGQSINLLPGITDAVPNVSPYQFVFFDTDPYISGVDLLYVADEDATGGGTSGLWKFTFDGTTWTAKGHLTGRIAGLTAIRDCSGIVSLFVSTANILSNNDVYKIVDNSLFLSNIANDGAAITTAGSIFIPAAGTTTAFRGLAITPADGYSVTTTQTIAAGNYNVITVKSGGTATLIGDIAVYDKIIVESGGTLIMADHVISSPAGIGSTFDLRDGGSLKIGHAGGIAFDATGNVRTCHRLFSSNANYEYNGTVPQVTGNALPSQIGAGHTLKINNSSGLGTPGITSSQPFGVDGILDLTRGKLTTGSIDTYVYLTQNGTAINYSDTSFVEGPLGKLGADTFFFPVGRGLEYAPIAINGGGPGAEFEEHIAEYFTGNPRTVIGAPYETPAINHMSVLEWWTLTRVGASSDRKVTLHARTYTDATLLSALRVLKWDGSIWVDEGNTAFSGISVGPVTSNLITNFHPSDTTAFTFGSTTSYDNPLPINLISFDATKLTNTKSSINWELAACCSAAARFEIQRAGTDKNFVTIGTVGGSETNKLYNYIDNGLKNGVNYYRLKMIDEDGKITYSRTVAVMNGVNGLLLTSLIPTMVTNSTTLTIASSKQQKLDLVITDMQGRIVKKQNHTIADGNTNIQLSTDRFDAGMYQIVGITAEGKTNLIRFIKQ